MKTDTVDSKLSLLRYDGIYLSAPLFERLDQTWCRYYFRFVKTGAVLKGVAKGDPELNDMMVFEPELGESNFKVSDNIITFSIGLPEYSFRSHWRGIVQKTSIEFSIENPDFEDISGVYKYFQIS